MRRVAAASGRGHAILGRRRRFKGKRIGYSEASDQQALAATSDTGSTRIDSLIADND